MEKRIPWNKGLTKKTSLGVARVALKKSEWWKNTDTTETRKKIGISSKNRDHPRGDKASGWKGGFFKTNGYLYIYSPNHPKATGKGYVVEHRLVMEKFLGRILSSKEDVHHKNGIKDDNRLENLELVSHFSHYEELGCPKCGFKFLNK